MGVLTCVDMVTGCLAGDVEAQREAWKRFVTHYVPFAAAVLDRHFPELAGRREDLLREMLRQTRDQDLQFFRAYQGQSEKEFLLHTRELAFAVGEEATAPAAPPEIQLDWEAFEKALGSFSQLERQIVWTLLLSGGSAGIGTILRLDGKTVEAALGRAQEALRAGSDRWSATMLVDNRLRLLQAGRVIEVPDCPPRKQFLKVVDGQNTWRERYALEQHLAQCWRCVDTLCRFREVMHLSAGLAPLSDAAAEPYLRILGITIEPPSRWKRLIGGN